MLGKFVQLRLQGVYDPFMSMANGKASPPPAPDYQAAAQATAAGNLEAAKYTTQANRVNQVTPYGNLTYTMTPTLDQGSYDKAMADYQAKLADYNSQLARYNSKSNNNNNIGMGSLVAGNTGSKGKAPIAPVLPTADAYQTGQSWTATQTMSPEQKAIYEQQTQLNQGLLSTANRGLDYANDILSKPGVDLSKLPSLATSAGLPTSAMMSRVDTSGLPGIGSKIESYGKIKNEIDPYGNIQNKIDPYGNIQNEIDVNGLPSYGINPGETYTDAIMRRLNPQIMQQSAAEEARLANQGIGLGSSAYKSAKDIFNQKQNDLLTSAQIQGMQTGLQANQQQFAQNAARQQAVNAAQAQGFGQNAAQAQFNNAAQAQGFGQNAAQAEFNNASQAQGFGQNAAQLAAQNAAQAQGFGQNLSQAQLANQVNQQEFNQGLANAQLQNTAQQQGFTQEAYNQMQPINVINALRTGAQVENPSYANVPQQANVAGADVLGATQAGYNAQLGAANAQNAASGNFMGGLMNLGGAYLMSDENLKTDIKRIGTHDSGVGIYSYNYKDGYDLPTGIQIGVLAQEIEKVIPGAVIVTDSGFKAVNYAML